MADPDDAQIPDYSSETLPPDVNAIRRLGQLAAKQVLLELEIEDLEGKLKDLKKEHSVYSEKLVPAVMAEIGLASVKTLSGVRVEVKDYVRASIPQDADRRDRAMKYITETGNSGIVEQEITISCSKNSELDIDMVLAALKDMGVNDQADVKHQWTIHNSRLVAFIKEELREGRNIPMDAFGAFVQKQAKIKRG